MMNKEFEENWDINPEFKKVEKKAKELFKEIEKLDISVNNEEKAHAAHVTLFGILLSFGLDYATTIGVLELLKFDICNRCENGAP